VALLEILRREGKWMHYRMVMSANEGAAKVLCEVLDWPKEEKAMQAYDGHPFERIATRGIQSTKIVRC
jgi:hypothetical protein